MKGKTTTGVLLLFALLALAGADESEHPDRYYAPRCFCTAYLQGICSNPSACFADKRWEPDHQCYCCRACAALQGDMMDTCGGYNMWAGSCASDLYCQYYNVETSSYKEIDPHTGEVGTCLI
ncbi:PREDICTED: uncharacterized protein LOC106818501 [Priapulus caudatus]|uniref:Uncharacterized protein LOC106818501 n=1 Tax=Priapulus caudatus TaxID=37621 RepID=A0ABM1F2L5_PRICU|nr:PREDICTED: uncharacterized protein LOC106818501 [Priapulus caudatus]